MQSYGNRIVFKMNLTCIICHVCISIVCFILNFAAHELSHPLPVWRKYSWDFKLATFPSRNSNGSERNLAAVRAFVGNWFYRILASHEKYYIPLRWRDSDVFHAPKVCDDVPADDATRWCIGVQHSALFACHPFRPFRWCLLLCLT